MKHLRSLSIALVASTAVLVGHCASAQYPEGWKIQVNLSAARQSAGAEWVRTAVLGRVLDREVLPGFRADDLWRNGTRLGLVAPATGTWERATWRVEGAWDSGLLAVADGLPSTGKARRYMLPAQELTRDRLPEAGQARDPDMAVRTRRTSTDRTLYIARNGNRLDFAPDVSLLASLDTVLPAGKAVVSADGTWLNASWASENAPRGLRQVTVTARDTPEGTMLVEVVLDAVDAPAAAEAARGLAGLLRMFESVYDERVSLQARDSLQMRTEGATVTASFVVPIAVSGGSEPTNGVVPVTLP